MSEKQVFFMLMSIPIKIKTCVFALLYQDFHPAAMHGTEPVQKCIQLLSQIDD